MFYYFDESGNWENLESEKNKFVISGILIKSVGLEKEITQEINLFKSRNDLKIIHANEMSDTLREEFYQIIYKIVQYEDVKVLSHYFEPKALYSQTIKSSDDLYIDIASKLITNMSFTDSDIKIDYDMKFHHAHPLNILNNIKSSMPLDFNLMQTNFELTKRGFSFNKNRITTILSRTLSKKRDSRLQQYYDVLCGENIKAQKKFILKYLWTEFRIKVENSGYMREKFKDKIETFTKEQYINFGLEYVAPKININYQRKDIQSAGVQIIDVICNLVWRYGNTPPDWVSSSIKGIYEFIDIKDITDDI